MLLVGFGHPPIVWGNFALRRHSLSSEIVALWIISSIHLMACEWPSIICGSFNMPCVCVYRIKFYPCPSAQEVYQIIFSKGHVKIY